MLKKTTWPIGLLFLLIFNGLQAQLSLSGTVLGAGKEGLADASVFLLRQADTSLIKTAFTEADGKFEFTEFAEGKVFVVVKEVDHLPYSGTTIEFGEAERSKTLAPIQLQAGKETSLETVQIVSKLPLVERKIDRTVVNVDAMITAAGGTAMDALEKSPGVSVDQNGGIRLKGKNGVVVFIDDKPTYMSGADLENYLRSLPASTIKQIELMTNPPAKYDAAGNAGVINIKTKKNNMPIGNFTSSHFYRAQW